VVKYRKIYYEPPKKHEQILAAWPVVYSYKQRSKKHKNKKTAGSAAFSLQDQN
jgi:hypothetical protein